MIEMGGVVYKKTKQWSGKVFIRFNRFVVYIGLIAWDSMNTGKGHPAIR